MFAYIVFLHISFLFIEEYLLCSYADIMNISYSFKPFQEIIQQKLEQQEINIVLHYSMSFAYIS